MLDGHGHTQYECEKRMTKKAPTTRLKNKTMSQDEFAKYASVTCWMAGWLADIGCVC